MSTTIRLPRRRDPRGAGAADAGRRKDQPPRRRRNRLLHTAGVLLAAVIVFFALNSIYGFTAGSSSAAGSRLTATVQRGTVLSSVSASGNVAVAQSASANFATGGTITAVDVSAGEHVKAGQALAKIDPTSARNALASARASLAMARSTLASADSGLTTAQRAANAISVQQAKLTVTADEQQLATDRSALATAEAQLARDAKLGFPASATSSGSGSTGSGSSDSASTGMGTGTGTGTGGGSAGSGGSDSASASSGSASTGAGSGSAGSGSASAGSGSASAGSGSASAGSGGGSAGSGSASTGAGGGSADASPTRSVLALVTGSTSTTGSTSPAPTTGNATPTAGPAVNTGSASAVGTSSATLSGSVTPGGLSTTYYFAYGTSPSSLSSTTQIADAGSSTGSVPVIASVSGLAAGRNYYFALVATNSSGTTNGSLGLFTTTASTPIVTTGQASSVGATGATLGGSVQSQGVTTSYYFEYGTSATNLGSHTEPVDVGSGLASVPATATLSGLSSGQTYYFALVASNSSGTSYGALALFTTGQASAVAATGQASAVGSTTATLSGTVDPSGLETTDHFEYGTSAAALSSSTPTFDDGSGSGSVSVSVTLHNLKPGTTYSFRLLAANSSGTSDGVDETFTTAPANKPTVVTGSASGTLTTSAMLSGSVNPAGTDTKYRFEYGTTSAYGSRTAVADAGSGTTASAVTATLTSLEPDTEYTFRLVARNRFGTSTGLSELVTTAPSSRVADEQAVTADRQAVQRQEATVATAKESLLETRATIASSDEPAAATIAGDKATVSEDRATVASDEEALGETTLRAPIAGTVTAVNASVGATASAGTSAVSSGAASSTASSSSTAGGASGASGQGSGNGASASGSSLFTIDSLGQLEIVAGFAEADATEIAVGQPVTITFSALPDTEVAGRVAAVSLTSTVVSNVVTYDETIRLIKPPPTVKEGMTADVSVVDQTATNVLYVPSAAVTTTGTISTVALLQNGNTTTTRVTTGLVGNSDTQISSGLKAGEVVVEPTVTVAGSTSTAGTTTGAGFGGGGFGGFAGGGAARFGG